MRTTASSLPSSSPSAASLCQRCFNPGEIFIPILSYSLDMLCGESLSARVVKIVNVSCPRAQADCRQPWVGCLHILEVVLTHILVSSVAVHTPYTFRCGFLAWVIIFRASFPVRRGEMSIAQQWCMERPAYDEKVLADLSQSGSLGSVTP